MAAGYQCQTDTGDAAVWSLGRKGGRRERNNHVMKRRRERGRKDGVRLHVNSSPVYTGHGIWPTRVESGDPGKRKRVKKKKKK